MEGRSGSDTAVFKKFMLNDETKCIKMFHTGDGDIIEGLCLMSYNRETGYSTVLTFITD